MRLKRLAAVFLGDPAQLAHAKARDHNRDQHHPHRPDVDRNPLRLEQPLDGRYHDPQTGHQHEPSLEKRRKVLNLRVPVLVVGIGRFVGDQHGPVDNGRSGNVEARVGGFGEDSQAVGCQARRQLHRRKHGRRQYRVQRCGTLLW